MRRLPPRIPTSPRLSAAILCCTTPWDSNTGSAEGHSSRPTATWSTRWCRWRALARVGRAALDLYAGAGLFTLALARKFDQVLAVESSPHSFADLRLNVPDNVKCIRATTERFLAERGPKLVPDLVLVDPPRAGLGEKTAAAIGRMSVSRVTYVSCDPATLSRDLRLLLESGFRVEQAHLVDMFPQTFHLETVLHLAR